MSNISKANCSASSGIGSFVSISPNMNEYLVLIALKASVTSVVSLNFNQYSV